jgi:hypothetical protein
MAPSFKFEDSTVSLIDTPGFDAVGSGANILKGMKDMFEQKGVCIDQQYVIW